MYFSYYPTSVSVYIVLLEFHSYVKRIFRGAYLSTDVCNIAEMCN